ncbi:hypothetical protein OK94_23335 [Salmonella enterica]|nr:hypothetical protein [Salmonella enterica]EAX2437526.1 hypothetical protein [Salmonella enterica]EBA2080884.1 hypothetical protein [Salmonella enterica]EBP1890562.1 hypothetical protein [Salmonella enterica]EEF3038138.1 hypothetical protein [Salmonella enterica]
MLTRFGDGVMVISLQQNLQPGLSTPELPDDAQHAPACFFVPVSHTHRIMVAQAGQPSGWPVSFGTGVENPVWATTS